MSRLKQPVEGIGFIDLWKFDLYLKEINQKK